MSREKRLCSMEEALCEILAEIGKSRTGIGVCLSAIAMARVAYEPFRLCTLEEFDAEHMTLAEANEILGYYPSDPPIPIVDK